MKEEKKIYSEKVLEKKLVEGIKKLGGKALKFYSEIDTSYPDRLIQMPGGKTYWVELKSTGKTQSPLQKLRAKELTQLGFMVFVIDTLPQVNMLLVALDGRVLQFWEQLDEILFREAERKPSCINYNPIERKGFCEEKEIVGLCSMCCNRGLK